MANIFAGGAVVAGSESIELPFVRSALRGADAVHIVEEFAEHATPGLSLGERVVGDQIEAAHVALQVQHQPVETGAVVGCENGGSGIRKRAIAVVSLLMDIVGASCPAFVESVLHTVGDVDGVRRFVFGIDERWRRGGIRVHRFQRGGPPVLREVVVVQAEAGANHRLLPAARRVGDSEARRNLLAVVMRNCFGVSQRWQQDEAGVGGLAFSGSLKKPEGGLIAQAVVDGEVVRYAPRILGIEPEPLDVLREAAVAAGCGYLARRQVDGELCEVDCIQGVVARVIRQSGQRFSVGCERAAEHGFVNKVDPELQRVAPRRMAQVVAHLILVLIAQVGKERDGSGKLVVAERLKSRDGEGGHAKRKLQRETQIRVARLGKMQQTRAENEIPQPRRTERVCIADHGVPVVVVRGQAGGGQRCLLHQGVVC